MPRMRSPIAAFTATATKRVEADIRDLAACHEACRGVHVVLHQAALGSVPRSIEDPIRTNESNIDGFLNMLVAARDAGMGRFVYAASRLVHAWRSSGRA